MSRLYAYAALALAAVAFAALIPSKQPTDLTERQKRAVVARLHTEILVGQLLYNLPQTFPPSVRFVTVHAVNAAETTCSPKHLARGEPDWKMHVNERIAAANWRAFMSETVPHEAAHLILCATGDPRWSEHGERWSSVVRELGAEPIERHTYERPSH